MDCPCGNPEGTNKECERCRLIALLDRSLNIISDAIMHGMPITEEVASVRNEIVRRGKSIPVADRCTTCGMALNDDGTCDDCFLSRSQQGLIDAMVRGCDEHRFGPWEPADDGTGTYFKTCTVCGHREECPF